jgi:hypothetical protein
MTKAEKAFQAQARDLGCIVCHGQGVDSPCDLHHILRGSRRIGEDSVIGLCPMHHRSGLNTKEVVSRHPWRREFEARYGTEAELLQKTRELCGELPE